MRGFIAFLIVCLVLFVGLGFYLGWFNVESRTDATTGKRHLDFSIDQAKLQKDAQKVADAVTDVLPGQRDQPREEFVSHSVDGMLQVVDDGARTLTVKTQGGRSLLVQVEDGTQVRLTTGAGSWRDLRAGMSVQVIYEKRGADHVAKIIVVMTPA